MNSMIIIGLYSISNRLSILQYLQIEESKFENQEFKNLIKNRVLNYYSIQNLALHQN